MRVLLLDNILFLSSRLFVHDERRLRTDIDTTSEGLAGGLLIDLAILTDNGVHGLGNGYLLRLTRGVEDDDDVAPIVATCIVLQAEGYDTLGGIEEFEVLAHQVGIAQAEGRMMLAQGNEVLVVFEHLRIALQIGPIQMVDAIGRLEGVVHTLLVAKQFLATEHEGNTLRGEDSSLSQEVETNQFVEILIFELSLFESERSSSGTL